ncbi:hypothetical protein [Nitrospira sp. BLG_1]|uniref:hypothetical protein n=1 Tax=Nitrospira sp. BLG_1 TaxID=3395883 RepID=UPI0039BD2813
MASTSRVDLHEQDAQHATALRPKAAALKERDAMSIVMPTAILIRTHGDTPKRTG